MGTYHCWDVDEEYSGKGGPPTQELIYTNEARSL